MDFFKASVPGSLGALVGHGVNGTYPQLLFIAEAESACQDIPISGDRPFLANPPKRFLIVAPIEFLELGVSPVSCCEVGLASRHF